MGSRSSFWSPSCLPPFAQTDQLPHAPNAAGRRGAQCSAALLTGYARASRGAGNVGNCAIIWLAIIAPRPTSAFATITTATCGDERSGAGVAKTTTADRPKLSALAASLLSLPRQAALRRAPGPEQ